MPASMSDDRLMSALSRIDQALARLESVRMPAGGDPALQAKHDALKAETRAAIGELDRLIAATKAA
jgi:hypothetical protein